MLPAFFIVLGFFALFIMSRDFSIGLVLSSLLGVAWYFVGQYKALITKVGILESNLSTLRTATLFARRNDVDETAKHTADAGEEPLLEGVHTTDNTETLLVADDVQVSTLKQAVSTEPTEGRVDDNIDIENIVAPVVAAADVIDSAVIDKDVYMKGDVEASQAVSPSSATPVEPLTSSVEATIERMVRKAIDTAWHWLTDGNVFVRAGIIILFMGMTFLLRYAIGENLIPIEIRLAAVASAAIGLLWWGWQQRNKRASFALVVQGGGIGLLYLTIFAGFSLYSVIPSLLAFVLLATTVVLATMLAVYQDSKQLALFATVGGFLAPILTSSGSNNYIGLFSYYTLLNLGVFAVAWSKSWRVLNFVGFVFTFVVASLWGLSSYQADNFSTVEPFLIIFFLMYVAIGVLYALKRTPSFTDYVDSSLIFGTPILAFGLQSAMVGDFEYGVAISAFCLAVFYLSLATCLWNKYGERLRLLSETFLSLGVIFATLAIPFAIDGTLTGASWAIEGAGIIWISIRQQQKYRRLFGSMLIVAAGVMLNYELTFELWAATGYSNDGNTGINTGINSLFQYAFANSAFIGSVIIAIAASLACGLLSRDFSGRSPIETRIANGLLVYGLAILFIGFEFQIGIFDLWVTHGNLLALVSLCCALVYAQSAKYFQWQQGHWVSLAMIVPLMIAVLLTFTYQSQLAQHVGYIVWPLSIVGYFYALKQAIKTIQHRLVFVLYVLISALIIGLLLWEGLWLLLLGYSLLSVAFHQLGHRMNWPQISTCALGFLPVLVICSIGAVVIDGNLVALSSIASDIHWPFPSGFVLWPFAFVVYFYLLYQNPSVLGKYTNYLHYAGALLIGLLLFWLGLWPLLLGASILCGLCCYLWVKFDWDAMGVVSLALLPVMLMVAGIKLIDNNFDPFVLQGFNVAIEVPIELGYILWPLAFTILFLSYYAYDKKHEQSDDKQESKVNGEDINTPSNSVGYLPEFFHGTSALLLVILITWEASWHILDFYVMKSAWHMAWLPVASLACLAIIVKSSRWPFSAHNESYLHYAVKPLLCFLILWSGLQLLSSGASAPLPWIPLVNPIDIMQLIIFVGCLLWKTQLFDKMSLPFLINNQSSSKALLMLGGFVFLWMNVDLLRAVHHWGGVAWAMPEIVIADISQTVLSLFWAICGLGITFYATQKQHRKLWVYGASLLGLVVVKLFVVDLSAQETIERIVSFTGVGVLLTLVGYFSPIPPKHAVDENSVNASVNTSGNTSVNVSTEEGESHAS
ncbi:MAG: putative membrane protein [Granulosicoccus sp.]|jgi:uncharacterized membrane protein